MGAQFHWQLGRVGSWQGQEWDWAAFDGNVGPISDVQIWAVNLHDEIEKLFPSSSNSIGHTATVAWANEPYTRASYPALAPCEVTAHWQTLFGPAGRLFFAGEHATPNQEFMEGAVENGQRAAATILANSG